MQRLHLSDYWEKLGEIAVMTMLYATIFLVVFYRKLAKHPELD